MKTRIFRSNLLIGICVILGFKSLGSAPKKPACVVETEKMLCEAENLESCKDLSTAKADECVPAKSKIG
jgi:hypothetical protein